MILKKIKTAIADYAEFNSTEVSDAVSEAFNRLEADLDAAGYEQSSKSDEAEQALDAAMNEADARTDEEPA